MTSSPERATAQWILSILLVSIGLLIGLVWLLSPEETVPVDVGARELGAGGSAGAAGSGGGPGSDDPPRPVERIAPLRLSPARVAVDEAATTGEVRGLVLSSAGRQPVPGATLSFVHRGATLDVRSEDDGSFRFVPPRAGLYALGFAMAPGFLPYAPELGHSPVAFQTRPGQRLEDVRVYLVPAVEYTGTVLAAAGDPVQGAEVRLLGADTGEQRLAPLDDRFRTDAEGSFRFHAPDQAILEARHPDHGLGRAAVGFETQVSRRLVIRLEPGASTEERHGRVAGRVVSASGEPVSDASVKALFQVRNRAAAGADLHPVLQTTAAADGWFALEGLEAGAYTVVATAPEHAPARQRDVSPGRDDLVLTLASEAKLAGRVRDEAGAPVAAFAVVARQPLGALEQRTAAVQRFFDPEGRFEVVGLAQGEYVVHVVADGLAPSAPRRMRTGEEGDFTLPRGGAVHGLVTSSEGGPIEGARVTLEGGVGEGPSPVPLTTTTTTDAAGRYGLEGVGAGAQSILASAGDHHGRVMSGLRVPPGERLRVDVELSATGPGEVPAIELAGIGAVLAAEGDVLLIGRVIEGGGAADAGLVPGDAIVAVEGVPVGELGFQGSIERIRGPEGSVVVLRVRRVDGTIEQLAVLRRRVRA